jgi:hypothetical protein
MFPSGRTGGCAAVVEQLQGCPSWNGMSQIYDELLFYFPPTKQQPITDLLKIKNNRAVNISGATIRMTIGVCLLSGATMYAGAVPVWRASGDNISPAAPSNVSNVVWQ